MNALRPSILPSAAPDRDAYSLMDSQDTVTPEITPQKRRKLLLAEYQEVCKSHAGVTRDRSLPTPPLVGLGAKPPLGVGVGA
jgi:hypothetical protein